MIDDSRVRECMKHSVEQDPHYALRKDESDDLDRKQSSRFQDIEVVPIGSNGQECSDRAEVRTTSKVAGNVSAMVHAIDPKSRTRLSCEVRVDYISTIKILTTTNVIFVDAVPVKIQIQARNSRGAAFSTLGALPFYCTTVLLNYHWMEYSHCQTCSTIHQDSSSPFSGSGRWKWQRSFDSKLLTKCRCLLLYHLRVDDSSICSLDISSSSVTALKKGTTEVVLLSHNIDSKMEGVSPPSTLIHVIEPRKMKWNVNGDNWLLEVGRKYKLYLTLFDSRDNLMYISDEARFETVIPTDHVTITHQSKNGTYFEMVAKKSGSALLKSRFSSIMVNTKGGSGAMEWRVEDGSIVSIGSSTGIVTCSHLGETTITAVDIRNRAHSAKATVRVVEVNGISFGKTRVESVEGGTLWLNSQKMDSDASEEELRVMSSEANRKKKQKNAMEQLQIMRREKSRPQRRLHFPWMLYLERRIHHPIINCSISFSDQRGSCCEETRATFRPNLNTSDRGVIEGATIAKGDGMSISVMSSHATGASDIAVIGLAVMGQNLILNMNDHGFVVCAYNRTTSKVDEFLANEAKGTKIVGAHSIEEICKLLKRPRRIVILVKAGAPVQAMFDSIVPFLKAGDIIIDSGNSEYTDSNRRTKELAAKGIHFVGTGISGGEEGARYRLSIMPGMAAYQGNIPRCLSQIRWTTVGEAGSGHFMKMVHNGIEYEDMQLIAEAHHLLKDAVGLNHDQMADVRRE
uniref:phosphogluconate dehydrogenase (NADP(+)-dependent, decarboxylating) n=1 Tax=Pristionchus pacificus TaxID=54126 RepID=A0A2A6CMQ9_PRIPA|eukprot:PDM79482.1 hypothetical protein PRIPAC_32061 [Pristionchus pacificus]